MVWKIAFLSSEGAPSVRNKITFRFGLPASSDVVPFRRLKAFSKANRYYVSPKDEKKKVSMIMNHFTAAWLGQ